MESSRKVKIWVELLKWSSGFSLTFKEGDHLNTGEGDLYKSHILKGEASVSHIGDPQQLNKWMNQVLYNLPKCPTEDIKTK